MEGRSMLEKIAKGFSKVKILVLGDIMLDRFIWGKVSRISPEAPVPVVVVDDEDFHLGGAANVVNNIHSLGGKVSLCGVVGDDEFGEKILRRLTRYWNRDLWGLRGRRKTVHCKNPDLCSSTTSGPNRSGDNRPS